MRLSYTLLMQSVEERWPFVPEMRSGLYSLNVLNTKALDTRRRRSRFSVLELRVRDRSDRIV